MHNRIEEDSTKFKNNDVLYYCARNKKEKREMKTKIFGAVFIAILLLSALGTVYMPTGNATVQSPRVGGNDPEPIDGTPSLEGVVCSWAQPDTGNTWTVVVFDDYYGGFYSQDFECVLEGVQCNIWVGLNYTDWDGFTDERVLNGPGVDDDVFYFAYPWTSVGWYPIGRSFLPGYRDYITGAQLRAVMDEFDNWIHEKDTTFFGDYDHSRTGPLGDGKIQILVFNIRDEFFYSPDTAPGFIMGYFWSYVSNLNNANIIHIDTWQWYRRQGGNPNGGAGYPYVVPPYSGSGLRPWQYEGTVAHEFQHLIHYDNDPNELSWVNEGCSTLAEFICGYGATTNLQYYMIYFWDTSLVIWEGNLENYGAVFLWTLYMYEHYGGQQLIWDIVHEQDNGIEGWNNVLEAHGIKKNFDQIFEDWAIANYLDDTSFAKGIYGYYGLDLPCAASGWWDIPYSIWYWGAYDETYWTGWFLPERLPYIAWYWELYNGAPELKVYFDGDDFAGSFPHSGTYQWHSDGTAWSWFRLGQTFSIPTGGATLKFWSNYDIEKDWDYGYVEVHDLTTDEWYTLPGIKTNSTIVNSQDNPNCPEDVEPTAYLAAGRWYGFTGNSGGWYQEQMDLSGFADHSIELYFTYWTDGYTLGRGWYIDDIEIPELSFFDDVESGANGWTANAGWSIITGVIENDFRVNVIETTNLIKNGTIRTLYHISPMKLNDATEEVQELIKVVNTATVQTGPAVLVMASQPGYEHAFATTLLFIVDDAPFEFIHYWTH
jgi:hypothetical protein